MIFENSMKKVEVTTGIKTTPAAIIAAFTDADMLRDWWNVEKSLIDARPGGVYTLAWDITDKGLGFVSTGIIKTYDPHNKLIIDNFVYLNPGKTILGPMSLTIKATEKGGMAELYLCQDGYQQGPDWDWYYEAVKSAWPAVVQALKEYLEKSEKLTSQPFSSK